MRVILYDVDEVEVEDNLEWDRVISSKCSNRVHQPRR